MVSVPTRGLLIPNIDIYSRNEDGSMVSVPTRGLLIPNLITLTDIDFKFIVSVPTRGLLIPNYKGVEGKELEYSFPSPQGVS